MGKKQTVKDKITNIVLFLGEGFILTELELITPTFRAISVNSNTHVLGEVNSWPDDFQGGHYTEIDGVWSLTSEGKAAQAIKDAEIEARVKKRITEIREANIKTGLPFTFPDGTAGTIDIKDNRDVAIIIGLGAGAMAAYLQEILKALAEHEITVKEPDVSIPYRDQEDQDHILTAMEAIQMGLSFMGWFSGIYKFSWSEKDKIKENKGEVL